MVSDSVDHLCIHYNRLKCDQVRNEKAYLVPLVEDIERRLLPEKNVLKAKFDYQRVLIRLLNNPMTKGIENFDGRANNLKNFFFGE